jgi:hypothetical protein
LSANCTAIHTTFCAAHIAAVNAALSTAFRGPNHPADLATKCATNEPAVKTAFFTAVYATNCAAHLRAKCAAKLSAHAAADIAAQ